MFFQAEEFALRLATDRRSAAGRPPAPGLSFHPVVRDIEQAAEQDARTHTNPG